MAIVMSIFLLELESYRSNKFTLMTRGSLFKHNALCNIDPEKVYGPNGEDLVWDALRKDALRGILISKPMSLLFLICVFLITEAAAEPLLASFMHASILSHSSLEKSLAFHMANLLASPSMISTQIQSVFLEALEEAPNFHLSLRRDILAVILRDPAVKSYTDVLLYFKGFQAIQTHRVANWLWNTDRATLGT